MGLTEENAADSLLRRMRRGVAETNDTLIMRWAGLRLVESRPGYARLELEVQPHHRGGGGTLAVNGAILAYMADVSTGLTALTVWESAEAAQVTVSLNLVYLRPIYGELAIAEGRIVHRGKVLIWVETDIKDAQGQMCAKATGIMRVFNRPIG